MTASLNPPECLQCTQYVNQIHANQNEFKLKYDAIINDNNILKYQIEYFIKSQEEPINYKDQLNNNNHRIEMLLRTNESLLKENKILMSKNNDRNFCLTCSKPLQELQEKILQSSFNDIGMEDNVEIGVSQHMEAVCKKYQKLEIALRREKKWSENINTTYLQTQSTSKALAEENDLLKSEVESLKKKLMDIEKLNVSHLSSNIRCIDKNETLNDDSNIKKAPNNKIIDVEKSLKNSIVRCETILTIVPSIPIDIFDLDLNENEATEDTSFNNNAIIQDSLNWDVESVVSIKQMEPKLIEEKERLTDKENHCLKIKKLKTPKTNDSLIERTKKFDIPVVKTRIKKRVQNVIGKQKLIVSNDVVKKFGDDQEALTQNNKIQDEMCDIESITLDLDSDQMDQICRIAAEVHSTKNKDQNTNHKDQNIIRMDSNLNKNSVFDSEDNITNVPNKIDISSSVIEQENVNIEKEKSANKSVIEPLDREITSTSNNVEKSNKIPKINKNNIVKNDVLVTEVRSSSTSKKSTKEMEDTSSIVVNGNTSDDDCVFTHESFVQFSSPHVSSIKKENEHTEVTDVTSNDFDTEKMSENVVNIQREASPLNDWTITPDCKFVFEIDGEVIECQGNLNNAEIQTLPEKEKCVKSKNCEPKIIEKVTNYDQLEDTAVNEHCEKMQTCNEDFVLEKDQNVSSNKIPEDSLITVTRTDPVINLEELRRLQPLVVVVPLDLRNSTLNDNVSVSVEKNKTSDAKVTHEVQNVSAPIKEINTRTPIKRKVNSVCKTSAEKEVKRLRMECDLLSDSSMESMENQELEANEKKLGNGNVIEEINVECNLNKGSENLDFLLNSLKMDPDHLERYRTFCDFFSSTTVLPAQIEARTNKLCPIATMKKWKVEKRKIPQGLRDNMGRLKNLLNKNITERKDYHKFISSLRKNDYACELFCMTYCDHIRRIWLEKDVVRDRLLMEEMVTLSDYLVTGVIYRTCYNNERGLDILKHHVLKCIHGINPLNGNDIGYFCNKLSILFNAYRMFNVKNELVSFIVDIIQFTVVPIHCIVYSMDFIDFIDFNDPLLSDLGENWLLCFIRQLFQIEYRRGLVTIDIGAFSKTGMRFWLEGVGEHRDSGVYKMLRDCLVEHRDRLELINALMCAVRKRCEK